MVEDFNEEDPEWLLQKAAECGDIEEAEAQVARGARFLNVIIPAAKNGQTNMLCWVMKKHRFGWIELDNCLVLAAKDGHLNTVEMLLENGADPYGMRDGALNLAELRKRVLVIECLKEARENLKMDLRIEIADITDTARLRQPAAADDEALMARALRMDCFGAVAKKIADAGETLTRDDMNIPVHDTEQGTLLSYAAETMRLHHIFRAELWRGRQEDMCLAWESVPEEKRAAHEKAGLIDFPLILDEHRRYALAKMKTRIVFRKRAPKV